MVQIELLQSDITKVECDAVVNAANSSLLGAGGVDGAIHQLPILEDCQKISRRQAGCETGQAVITTEGRLPAKYGRNSAGDETPAEVLNSL